MPLQGPAFPTLELPSNDLVAIFAESQKVLSYVAFGMWKELYLAKDDSIYEAVARQAEFADHLEELVSQIREDSRISELVSNPGLTQALSSQLVCMEMVIALLRLKLVQLSASLSQDLQPLNRMILAVNDLSRHIHVYPLPVINLTMENKPTFIQFIQNHFVLYPIPEELAAQVEN